MISIHKGSPADFDQFYASFENSLASNFKHYSKKIISYLLKNDYPASWLKERVNIGKKVYFLATFEDQIIGYFLVSKPFAGVSLGDWLSVDKKFQKQGIATQLIQQWEDYAKNEGAHALQLWTTEENVDFYKKRGFLLAGKFPESWYGIDRYLFYKNIQKPLQQNYLKD
nr:Acetyltransferase (GNAT) family [uncultured bacterium]